MALNTQAIVDQVASHAAATGHFERVNQHEPASSPGHGLTAAVWVSRIHPVARASGLAATSARLALLIRVYSSDTQEPRDAIDPVMMDAVDALLAAYSGDFELGGQVRNVDLLGAHGVGLSAEAGYQPVRTESGATVTYRVMTITLPLIINDVWAQEA